MFNKEFTDLINELFKDYEKYYTEIYTSILNDFNVLEMDNTIVNFRNSLFAHMVDNSNLSDTEIDDLYYSYYECYNQDDGLRIEIELDYLIDELCYNSVHHSMLGIHKHVYN